MNRFGKGPRRVARVVVVALTLGALGWAGFNWAAARARASARDGYVAAGGTLELQDLVEPPPPAEANFAMIPVIAELRESMGAQGGGDGDSAEARLRAMRPDSLRSHTMKGNRDVLRAVAEEAGLSGSFGEMLAAYDQAHAGVLAELRAGLDRPVSSASILRGVGRDEVLYGLNEAVGMTLGRVADGLSFRASLALEADRPEVAWECVKIRARLAETIGSSGSSVGRVIGAATWRGVARDLKRILAAGGWNPEDAAWLADRLEPGTAGEVLIPGIEAELIAYLQIVDLAKHHTDYAKFLWMDRPSVWSHCPSALIPDGYFDVLGTRAFEDAAAMLAPLRTDGTWHRLAAELRAAKAGASGSDSGAMGLREILGLPCNILLHEAVVRAQARLALALEEHRTRHGGYPATLEEIGGEATLDPVTGSAFEYSKTGAHGYRLYSVGVDGKDDSGRIDDPERPSRFTEADWVW